MTVINSSFGASFSNGGTLTLAADAYLVSTTYGLILTGDHMVYDVTVSGLIQGNQGFDKAGIALFITNSASITIDQSGLVRGDSGIFIDGAATIVNHGGIFANSNSGIFCQRDGNISITNTGTIQAATSDAIFLGFSDPGTQTIDNSGIISASEGSYAIYSAFSSAAQLVINTGLIKGDIFLSGRDDIVHNESGIIKGGVYLYDGDDQFTGGLSAVNLDAGAGDDSVTGGAGEDVLVGGEGDDTVAGGAGNDQYYVDSPNDVIVEEAGDIADVVYSTSSFTLDKLAHIEYLMAADAGSTNTINLTGNALTAQYLSGNDGSNILNGGGNDGSADHLVGFGGDDTYVLGGETLDSVTDSSGNDKITSTISRNLADYIDIENLTLLGNSAIDGAGDGVANTIVGNGKSNVLNGAGGSDTLTGLAGRDTFVFDSALKSTNVDTITDFNHNADAFDIDNAVFKSLTAGTLAKADFKAISSANSTAGVDSSDRILYDRSHGDLYFDRDGSGNKYERVLFAHVVDGTSMDNTDFHIV